MLKITLWFDRFDTEQEHFEELKNLLLFSNNKFSFNICGIFYTKEIGQLLYNHKANITDVSFINLERGTKVNYNNLIYSVGVFNMRDVIIKNDNSTIPVQFGDFVIIEDKDENMVS